MNEEITKVCDGCKSIKKSLQILSDEINELKRESYTFELELKALKSIKKNTRFNASVKISDLRQNDVKEFFRQYMIKNPIINKGLNISARDRYFNPDIRQLLVEKYGKIITILDDKKDYGELSTFIFDYLNKVKSDENKNLLRTINRSFCAANGGLDNVLGINKQ